VTSRLPRPLALALLLLAVPGAAAAQTRPLRTEPATTERAGSLVLETGLDLIAGEPSYVTGARRTRWDGPLLRLVYSPADAVELDVEWIARVGVWGEPGRGDIASSEPGDVTLRAKWRIRDGGPARSSFGARFGVILPETSYDDKQFRPLGLGPNTLRAFLEGLWTRPIGQARLHANAGLFLHDEVYRPHDQRDFLSYGLALEWPTGRGLTLLAEIQGRAGEGKPGAQARSELRAGLRLGRGRLRWDAALRRGLAWADGRWGVSAGLAWTAREAAPRP
jgi:hypothetical protein